MNKQPAPEPSPSVKFERLLKRVISVQKSEIDRREAIYKEERAEKKRAKANGSEEGG